MTFLVSADKSFRFTDEQVAIDGNHYCEYSHRVSYSQANTLQITGDVQVSMIEFKSTNTYPTFPSGNRLNVTNPVMQMSRNSKHRNIF